MDSLKTYRKISGVLLVLAVLGLIILFNKCGTQIKPQQEKDYSINLTEERRNKNVDITDSTSSRFNKEEREMFVQKGLKYYLPDEEYIVEANFTLDTNQPPFQMETTTARKPNYRVFGFLEFQINDTLCKLTVYQNMDYKNSPDYDGTVFIPFKDNTNEFGTYGGGRYLDIGIPISQTILLDFNKAYNPYCAYSDRWSCPIVPMVNTLPVSIFAGEKAYK